jgi:hypothetical protein
VIVRERYARLSALGISNAKIALTGQSAVRNFTNPGRLEAVRRAKAGILNIKAGNEGFLSIY